MSTVEPVFRIIPTTQTYAWGNEAANSKVAEFASTGVPGFNAEESTPYAELWMGTHVTSPSGVFGSQSNLPQILAANPHLISDQVSSSNGGLPFLFKVLSIRTALSIQIHPDKEAAKRLFAVQKDLYKDDNHKPEMAIALKDFEALCGFLPVKVIAEYLKSVEEFRSLFPKEIVDDFYRAAEADLERKVALPPLFSALMSEDESHKKLVQVNLSRLVERYIKQGNNTGAEKLVLTLHEQYPGDVGVFCAFLLNHIKLEAGEAIFLGAGIPHAYVCGDIMECMANSDNVIRAGLTPKKKDVKNLLENLDYNAGSNRMDKPSPSPGSVTLSYDPSIYDSAVQDFKVLAVELKQAGTETHKGINGPSIAIATAGSGSIKWDNEKSLELTKGIVVFIGAGVQVSFQTEANLTVYRAYSTTL
ncbi:hypothetical protein HYDPIDRAFT_25311 [Hydnomerulius pinastri MD-312]|nr:hypothetical protein HYDPIDRAFT_25311 [Hydnomerulius pinastri MD-312]